MSMRMGMATTTPTAHETVVQLRGENLDPSTAIERSTSL